MRETQKEGEKAKEIATNAVMLDETEIDDVSPRFDHLTAENRETLALFQKYEKLRLFEPERFRPLWKPPCRVKVLIVADGGLDFSLSDFGLRAFVDTLRTMPGFYVRFEITLAHINNVSADAVMAGHPGISRSITQFKFDDPSHFTPTMYDQVWLFGILTSYSRGNNPRGQPYPNNRLGDAELQVLGEFMNGGGGLFATGDHGYLGVCLSGSIPRARSMRLWGDTSPNQVINEVSMDQRRRNDTTRLGPSAGSQFNDQSDDVPQDIQPKMYTTWAGIWKNVFPHPLLCGRRGVIRVLPDHPHEGQCVEPSDTTSDASFVEYPPSTGGFARPLPQVIATSTVLAGTTAGIKQPTEAQAFGAICAYDGHLAGVGRVVTDATWHHFVNVNLTGDSSVPDTDPKKRGFLQTPSGQEHLEDIKTYYRNIAVWLSRPALLTCMRWRLLWGLIYHHRVMEAVVTRTELSLDRADISIIHEIGRHARDVLDLYAGHCQSRRLALDVLVPIINIDLLVRLDPWIELPEKTPPIPEPDPIPWFDLDPILDAAVGGAIVAIREEFREPDENVRREVTDEALEKVVNRGVRAAVELSFRSVETSSKIFGSLFTMANDYSPTKGRNSESPTNGGGRRRGDTGESRG